MQHIDYIIVGQGVSGTFLSYYLTKYNKKVLVIDELNHNAPSRVASGIINPVTGRRVVRTWKIDELLPFAEGAYREIGEELGIQAARPIDILNFHNNAQMAAASHERIAEGDDFLAHISDSTALQPLFDISYGIDVTSGAMLVALSRLLNKWRDELQQRNALLPERFLWENCDITDTGVVYGGYKAEKIILCNGVAGFDNPYFRKLPYAFSKGEAIRLSIPGLPQDNIYKQGLSLVPLGADEFWLGSSFEWDYHDDKPTAAFRDKAVSVLKSWLKLPYEILDHTASVRPGSLERRPFVGVHPGMPAVAILNGMGTKGCSLAPYFAAQLSENLLNDSEIDKEADINRFKKALKL